ncbi:hydroxymethylbilane synthase [Psychroserpens ponticola]|uniref:Hydroxymethylbilane synthase n=1 Tax=Psychroserpens ponticola TaxID=2932268 RepID=A0ABY7RXU5_9FLAO|nr:hydroxymethylbilane synthase [Psychroserpens ponticola]WCO01577.1 hydroxymethylbilane synthase [Psychroserpens ponticola]
MSKIIRIGTRDSELALWQAKTVQSQLEHLGHKTQIVPVKSTGDIVLDKPIYELGITGVFTKTLDIAMLNEEIDIAVHSLKDVPTLLPKGIVQAAVLKRGNVRDCLVFKRNEEFLSQRDAVIATGSLRRRAQWLNRYPTHTIVGLRGNVNSRLQKLEDNDWNGAVFAAAGLGRLDIRPEESFNLEWMIPAPAQGAVMITALESDEETLAICAEINHKETEIATSIEREFLNRLEGGCSAPIGALAFVKDEEVHLQAVLLSLDGSKKIEVQRTVTLDKHDELAQFCADYIIERGGKRLMDHLKKSSQDTNIYSTKTLTDDQKQLFHEDVVSESSDFIKISLNRMTPKVLKPLPKNVIITSKNAVEALLTNFAPQELQFENIYCVGRKTKRFVERKIGKVKHTENNSKALAEYLVEYIDGTEVTYFCSDIRMDELPSILNENNIVVKDVTAYETKYDSVKINDTIKGVMFYSPSTVQSYKQENDDDVIAFCIGETTAKEASKHFDDVRIAKIPTVESVIELVNEYFQ